MSSRSVEGSPCREWVLRPPLRSVENDKERRSTPLILKSKSLKEKEDVCFAWCSPPPSDVTHSMEMAARGHPDVTFKSFICSGGEVEISEEPSLCTEDHIFLPQRQTACHTFETEDTGTSETCSVHAEHPYSRSERTDPSLDDLVPANVSAMDVTRKLFVCDNSEVEVLDGSTRPDEAVPLALDGECEINLSHCQCEGALRAAGDVTFKSFTCSGGEVEIPNVTEMVDETVSLPAEQRMTDHSELSFLGADVQLCIPHFDHPYCHFQSNVDTFGQDGVLSAVVALPEEQAVNSQSLYNNKSLTPDPIQKNKNVDVRNFTPASNEIQTRDCLNLQAQEPPNCHCDNGPSATCCPDPLVETNRDSLQQEVVSSTFVAIPGEQALTSQFLTDNKSLKMDPIQNDDVTGTPETLLGKTLTPASYFLEDIHGTPEMQSDDKPLPALPLRLELSRSSEAKDSALGSSENGPNVQTPADKPLAATMPEVLKALSECSSLATALQLISPVRRRSLSLVKALRNPADVCQKNPFSPDNKELGALWEDNLESPMPCPLLSSTTVCNTPQPEHLGKKLEGSGAPGCSSIPAGPLQQQLRQMAEFLILVSGKMDFAAPPAAPLSAPPPASCSVCVGVTPVKRFDRSLNTSGEFERKGRFSVADACTLTDPLLWNCPPGSLECISKEELEQRLMSSMIMAEALVQQLAVARAPARGHPAGPPLSEMRDRLVQTDHTELRQTTMHRDLYMAALNRIGDLEQDGRSLQEVVQYIQGMRATMTSFSNDTVAALSDMKQIEALVRDDHQSLTSHYGEMKLLCSKFKETQMRMSQKVKETFRQRDEMKTQMEDALAAKEAAFSTLAQLRTRCASEMATLERNVGSQRELLAVLNVALPEQVALNKTSTETLKSASELVCQTMEDQSNLTKELSRVSNLMHRVAPSMVKLNEATAAALRERDEHMAARDRALEDRGQLEEDLKRATLSLQSAEEQIGDLNLQVTILNSEMGVLRQKLLKHEGERAQLERTVTEMSATVSSTTAAHTFLEHTLAEETSKLQQAQRDASQAKEMADQLLSALRETEERADELSRNLAERESELGRLQALSESQSIQIGQLSAVCVKFKDVVEMNEFLHAENEVAREQLVESENILRILHERNIQCEDMKRELCQLQREKRSAQEELEAARARAGTAQQKQAEEVDRAVTETALLHYTLRGVTDELHDMLGSEKPQPKKSEPALRVECPDLPGVDSVMVASTAEEKETITPAVAVDLPRESIFSEKSAFTRLPVIRKNDFAVEEFEAKKKEAEEGGEQAGVLDQLAHLSKTVTEIVSTLKSLRRHKDAREEELKRTASHLEMALQTANEKHAAAVSELNFELSRTRIQAAHRDQALQQQAEDVKMITKLMTEVAESQEMVHKYKTDCEALRKETTELRRSLQQTQSEVQILRGELMKASRHPDGKVDVIEEKLLLLKEVERLKNRLQEMEQTKGKLIERAKRHQLIHQMNQEKCENEVRMLDNMMAKVWETLLSLPEELKECEQLQQLLKYLGR
ncbi:sperm-associated antigen 5 [Syngnathoides biaculeatus]|uniref:sperm-associated antigen 5 n=1 Tax=Syngnathoides biaculeatus TaxID=300417 RepID=UPI002ADE4AB1|nr:sperm-associated antigen 5 [Syngnathoides biaculeatus]XP_061684599.1 sperm-associated antigen 5 [Syngnathoides biaculeatus]